jgi:hypothetical protein
VQPPNFLALREVNGRLVLNIPIAGMLREADFPHLLTLLFADLSAPSGSGT